MTLNDDNIDEKVMLISNFDTEFKINNKMVYHKGFDCYFWNERRVKMKHGCISVICNLKVSSSACQFSSNKIIMNNNWY